MVTHSFLQKIKDITPEVKQATDRESRDQPYRGMGRGRGRGGAAGYAVRGLSAAGLTSRGGAPHRNNSNGDATSADA